jgi:hypothetical protein
MNRYYTFYQKKTKVRHMWTLLKILNDRELPLDRLIGKINKSPFIFLTTQADQDHQHKQYNLYLKDILCWHH